MWVGCRGWIYCDLLGKEYGRLRGGRYISYENLGSISKLGFFGVRGKKFSSVCFDCRVLVDKVGLFLGVKLLFGDE